MANSVSEPEREFVYAGLIDAVVDNLIACVSYDYNTVYNALCLFPYNDRYIIIYPVNELITEKNHVTCVWFEQGDMTEPISDMQPVTTKKNSVYVSCKLIECEFLLTTRLANQPDYTNKKDNSFTIELEMDKVYDYDQVIPKVVFASYSKKVKSLFKLSYEATALLGHPLPDYLTGRYTRSVSSFFELLKIDH